MSHPINLCLQELDKTAIGKLWAPIDALFMAAMDELIVLDLPGWQESSGIKREMDSFAARGCRVSLWSEVAGEFIEACAPPLSATGQQLIFRWPIRRTPPPRKPRRTCWNSSRNAG